jgi:hypothetical protein
MKTLVKLSILGSLALGFSACGNEMVDEVSAWKDKICACKDKECALEQGKAYVKLGDKLKAQDKPSEGDLKKIMKLDKEGRACMEAQGVDLLDLL